MVHLLTAAQQRNACVAGTAESWGRFPSRRTWGGRLKAIAGTLPEQIGCLGGHLIEQMGVWETTGRAVAFDRTVV